MIMITGGSKCGKSRYAESLFQSITKNKYYIATMIPYGDEAESAIARHRKMRENKRFFTIEQYTDIDKSPIPMHSAVLLECMGNLVANEMFQDEKITDCTNKIIDNILSLNKKTDLLVIVTNQVGNDGITYASGTARYIESLGKINRVLSNYADCVIECVYGIPVKLKG